MPRNLLDFALVALSLLELSLSWATGKDTNGGTVTSLNHGLAPTHVPLLRRVLRLLKFARILRSLKVITAFRVPLNRA